MDELTQIELVKLKERLEDLEKLVHQHVHKGYDDTAAIEVLGGAKGRIKLTNLPVASAGLADNSVWNDSGTLKII